MSAPSDLERLATLCGIQDDYQDVWGQPHAVSDTTRRALLGAMHALETVGPARLVETIEEADWRQPLPPVRVLRAASEAPQVPLTIPAGWLDRVLRWRLTLESGQQIGGDFHPQQQTATERRRIGGVEYLRFALAMPVLTETGYHRFEIEHPGRGDETPAHMSLIVVPVSCFQPDAVRGERRVWGPVTQFYGLRSQRNWGIGDFGDLRTLVELTARAGGGVVGVNPLHALFPDQPQRCSPYSPSSRLFLNVLYIDVDAVIGASGDPALSDYVADPAFQARVQALRDAELVDYEAVAAIKLDVLRRSWQSFCGRHLAVESERAQTFRQFRAARGEALQRHALFEALQAHFHAADEAVWGWPAWPAQYRDPAAAPVQRFAAEHAHEVDFHAYLQWLADEQLTAVGNVSWTLGLGIGLYQDFALGVSPGGSDTWAYRDAYAIGAYVGAPPDEFSPHGQDWGLPPFVPQRLRELAYAPFIEALRATMRPSGALRLDHVMGLMRLFWVPAGRSAREGAYVSYPFDDLLGIVALESERNQCLVIGEDLGTVPDALRSALAAAGVLSYRPLLFERTPDGAFEAPRDYPAQALVAVSTHDLPTLRGCWRGTDLVVRAALGLFPSRAYQERATAQRALDRARLLIALDHEKLLPADTGIDPQAVPDIDAELSCAVHAFVARTPSRLLAVQPEDIFGCLEQANLPGSVQGHPNWRRKLPVPLEAWADEPRWQTITARLCTERGSSVWPRERPAAAPLAVIPRATYRLQFNSSFTLADATTLVPYLAELGISHCYASPYLRARPGSTHGYDIVDHNAINPQIGSRDDFERFVDALAAHGMGQILDMVPNHMGVMGADNAWWLDVLENGAASVYADYFDIDWRPLNPQLHGKVLLPLLGDHYGSVLARGELRLGFNPARGEFDIRYFDHRLPIDPAEYPRIAGHQMPRLAAALGGEHEHLRELQSLLTAFGNLPPRHGGDAQRRAERDRDKEVHKRHLAALCEAQPAIRQHIEQCVVEFNGRPQDPDSFDLLHALIQAQAWRAAYWRVASDDINYRRFFDINDLAALRMENPAVFDNTHQLVLELIAEGKLHGLRIDHPDGLYDPRGYFERLQRSVCERIGVAVSASEAPAALPLYLVVEKILAEHERLPDDWPVHGTTGYRFANQVNGLFVDAAAQRRMGRIYADFVHQPDDFDELVYQCKRLIMRTALASELSVLATRLARIAAAGRQTCDFTLNGLRTALGEVVACFPVYRTYVVDGQAAADDRRHIEWAVAVARRRSQAADVSIYDFVRDVLTTDIGAGKGASYRDQVNAFAMKVQQFSAPVTAKGLEDTAFYRYHRLCSLNEVGADPRRFGLSVAAYHVATHARARRWPHEMLATSTHDSKRAEDVRARLNVLSELPAAWKLTAQRWRRLNRGCKRLIDDVPAPSANDEYLLYQTLIGSYPLTEPDSDALADYRGRITAYMQKAVREAKQHSSWVNVNAAYEAALAGFVEALLTPGDSNPFLAELAAAAQRLAGHGLRNSLAQTLLKLTAPGVPDIYQGSELWQFHLVDPDNRRPVDYDLRRARLAQVKALLADAPGTWPTRLKPLVDDMTDGRIKLYLTWRTLQLRARWPELFRDGDYEPLVASGAGSEYVVAYARRRADKAIVVVVPRLLTKMAGGRDEVASAPDWRDTCIALPASGDGGWYDLFTGCAQTVDADGALAVDVAFGHFPVVLLVNSADVLAP